VQDCATEGPFHNFLSNGAKHPGSVARLLHSRDKATWVLSRRRDIGPIVEVERIADLYSFDRSLRRGYIASVLYEA